METAEVQLRYDDGNLLRQYLSSHVEKTQMKITRTSPKITSRRGPLGLEQAFLGFWRVVCGDQSAHQ
jgi:hypothetical protein